MKSILSLILITLCLNASSQVFFKDKKQEVFMERVVQNQEPIFKIYFKTSYLNLGSLPEAKYFLKECSQVLDGGVGNTVFVGNSPVTLTQVGEALKVEAKGSEFLLSRKQFGKIKNKLETWNVN